MAGQLVRTDVDVRSVGGADGLACQDGVGRPLAAHPAFAHEHEPVAVDGGQVQVVEHRQDGQAALAAERMHDVVHAGLMAQVQMGRRLVEEQHLRLLRERARHKDPLALATREPIDRSVLEVRDLELCHCGTRDRQVLRAREAEPRQMRRAPHQHHLQRRERKLECRILRHDGEETCDLGATARRERLAVEAYAAARGREHAGQQPKERRLAAAVRTDEPDDLAPRDREADVVQHRAPAVGEADALGLEPRRHPVPRLRLRRRR